VGRERVTAPEDAALAYWAEHREQFRQSENQRAVLTNYVLVIAAAVSGLVVQQGFKARTLPLSILIVVVGLYGALAVAKYHERATYHLSQARALTQLLVESGGLADHDALLEEFRQAHYLRYPRLHRLRLSWLWTGLHLGVAAYGVVLVIITVLVR
jgi:type IV secretory pathway TrbF-like protein